jgi:Fic family protein
MARGSYRVEVSLSSSGRPRYFLVKDVMVRGKKRKVSKYIRSGDPPSKEELDIFKREHAYELELKAARKKAELSRPYYSSNSLDENQILELEELRFIFQRFHELLTVNELEVYDRNFEINYISGTTRYEGNTLSLEQTRDLLLAGLLPENKKLREINEVQNFKKVVQYRNSYKKKVNLDFIRNLHALVMDNIDIESAGTFRRTDDVAIAGCSISPVPAIMIEEDLQEAIDIYHERLEGGTHPFEAAMMFHYTFETVHPFTDGNGRVGREVLNYMLKREKFPRLLFLGKDRERYIAALRAGNQGNYGEMVSMLSSLILSQRMQILQDNLRKVVIPPLKRGQTRLTDYE